MSQPPWHNAWTSIDKTSDPAWFIDFLDDARADAYRAAEQDPRQYFSFLDVHEGQQILEIGFGTGDITQALARLVGPGKVIGVDPSETMLAEAKRRSRGRDLPLEFRIGDVQNLRFPDSAFDRSFATAVFQHIENPDQGLKEMIRVTKVGGRVVIADQDWETFVVTADEDAVSRKMIHFFRNNIRNGSIAHHLPIWFQDRGLTNITVEPLTMPMFSPAASLLTMFLKNAEYALGAGAVSEAEAKEWTANVSQRNQAGRLFSSFTVLRVSGVKA